LGIRHNVEGTFMSGECRSVPTLLPDGRLRLDEEWRWTTGDRSSGRSIVEELRDSGLPPGALGSD